jgi:hypothetical protein
MKSVKKVLKALLPKNLKAQKQSPASRQSVSSQE